jgi:hypothetical protein
VEIDIVGFSKHLVGHSGDCSVDGHENLRLLPAPLGELVLLVLALELARACVRRVLVCERLFLGCEALALTLALSPLVLDIFLFFFTWLLLSLLLVTARTGALGLLLVFLGFGVLAISVSPPARRGLVVLLFTLVLLIVLNGLGP